MYSGPRNTETRGGRPRKFDPQTRSNPKNQNLNHLRHQPILNFMLKKPKIPKTWGGCPQKFDPQTWPDPEKQNPNQPQHQLILNFILKIPETPKTQVGHPWNVDSRTWPELEKQTLNSTRPRLLFPEYIPRLTIIYTHTDLCQNLILLFLWISIVACSLICLCKLYPLKDFIHKSGIQMVSRASFISKNSRGWLLV